MPLTNAQKQARARDKRARTMARWEGALQRIVDQPEGVDYSLARDIARNALQADQPPRLHSNRGE